MSHFVESLIRVCKEQEKLHRCQLNTKVYGDSYGSAIDECFELEDGTLVAGNGEYYSYVNFCPKCGFKAKKLSDSIKS